MKKSNKILLGGFILAVLLVTALHVTLLANYRNGNYVAYQAEDELASMVMQSFPHVKFVSVRHVPNLNVHFSDSAQVQQLEGNKFKYTQTGDTLLISGPESRGNNDFVPSLAMRLPRNASVNAYKSMLSFTDSKGPKGGSPMLFLDASSARFYGTTLDALGIHAVNRSNVEFGGGSIGSLQLQLQQSILEDAEGNIGTLTISSDSLSRVALQSKHFSKAKANTPSNE